MAAAPPGVRRSELGDALRACRGAFIGVFMMSCIINLLYLTGSIFMLEVYDRVLPSRSVPTLVGLVVIAAGLYMAQGFLDLLRGRILGRVGTALDEALNARVFDIVVRLPLVAGGRSEGLQPLRDLDNVRSFLGSMGPGAFFDLPWLPFYLAICFAFHVMIGLTALVGAIFLVGLTLITEYMSRQPAREAMTLAARRNDLAAASRRNAEVLVAMGMAGRLNKRWNEANEKYLTGNQNASDVTGGLGAVSKVMRMMLQSAVLGVGAYLVIHQEATAGIIIAGSILSRAGAGAGRSRDRALEGFRRRPAELASPQQAARADAGAAGADAAAESVEPSLGRGRRGRRARRSARDHFGRDLRAAGRQRPWRDRALRLRQVVADPRAGRRLAAVPRQGPHRRRGAGPMVVRRARPVRRLSAAGRRAVRRLGGAEHLPLRSRRQVRQDHRRRQGSRRARHDHQDARRLQHPGRRAGHRAVGGPGAARGAGARAVRRSLPDRARRAQFQSRHRGRRGAEPRGARRARARRHRGRGRAPADRHRGGRPDPGAEGRPHAGLRSEGAGAGAGAAAARRRARADQDRVRGRSQISEPSHDLVQGHDRARSARSGCI